MPPTEQGADTEPGGDLPSPEGSGRRLPGYLPSDQLFYCDVYLFIPTEWESMGER